MMSLLFVLLYKIGEWADPVLSKIVTKNTIIIVLAVLVVFSFSYIIMAESKPPEPQPIVLPTTILGADNVEHAILNDQATCLMLKYDYGDSWTVEITCRELPSNIGTGGKP